jgi:transposase
VLTRVVIFSYILGFCRYVIFDISLSDNQGSVFEAMENALRETGGVPERIQTDNAKSFVVNASKDHFKWNSRYLQFCGHYGIRCRQSKKYN